MRVISIINLKGGVGKTFTAANMAHILNNQGKSVLLVDNDKQGNLSKLFGVYQDDVESGSAKLLRGWYKSINDLRVVLPGYAGLDIIPANMSLLQATNDLTVAADADQVERFKPLLQAYPLRPEEPYDYIIIDNPPDLGLNVINALAVSDDVIVPTNKEVQHIHYQVADVWNDYNRCKKSTGRNHRKKDRAKARRLRAERKKLAARLRA